MPNTIFGNETSQGLVGTAANDVMYGGGGNDYLAGGAGNDVLVGGKGADYMEGGSGGDTFTFFTGDLVKIGEPGGRLDTIADFTGGGQQGGDNMIFYGFGKGGSLAFHSNSFNGQVEDPTKQYYDVIDSSGVYQGTIFILMADGFTGKLVAGVDYFFGN